MSQCQRANGVSGVDRDAARTIIVVFDDRNIEVAVVVKVADGRRVRRADPATEVTGLKTSRAIDLCGVGVHRQ